MKKIVQKIVRLSGRLSFALLLSVCMIIGVAPIPPKRKESFAIEIKAEQVDKKDGSSEKQVEYNPIS